MTLKIKHRDRLSRVSCLSYHLQCNAPSAHLCSSHSMLKKSFFPQSKPRKFFCQDNFTKKAPNWLSDLHSQHSVKIAVCMHPGYKASSLVYVVHVPFLHIWSTANSNTEKLTELLLNYQVVQNIPRDSAGILSSPVRPTRQVLHVPLTV